MWALLSTPVRRWIFFVIGAPLLSRMLHGVATALELRATGPTVVTRALRGLAAVLGRLGGRSWRRVSSGR